MQEVGATLSGITLRVVEMGVGASRATYLEVRGTVTNPSDWLESNERVRLIARSSAGDSEELLVGPEICDRFYSCNWLTVWMEWGKDSQVLVDPVEHLGGAALSLGGICDSLTGECNGPPGVPMVYVFDSADMSRMHGALAWVPGVASVGRSVVGYLLGMPSPESQVHSMFPLRIGTATAYDGVIQASDGGGLTVTAFTGGAEASLTVLAGGDPVP